MMDIILTIGLNVLPLIILIIPLLFIRKKIIGKLYYRIVLGLVVFYLIYWILPIIFQLDVMPNELTSTSTADDAGLEGILFIAAHMGSLISLFASYPLVTLPFIFFVAPFISLIFVWNKLRKEEGSMEEKLKQITYEYSKSPLKKIREELEKNDWSREKEILKLLIVLLPISLYLLQVILDISNMQNVSLTEGSTSLGWFIEILFVYLAIFIFGIELLYSSQIAFKGRYFGEDIRSQTYKSLYQVGMPISILSLLLFILQYTTSIFIIIYFFAYFIMASIIFILFIDIFEPISIFVFIKLVNWWASRKEKKKNMDGENFYIGIIYGGLALIIFLVSTFIFSAIYSIIGNQAQLQAIYDSGSYTSNPSLMNAILIDVIIILNYIAVLVVPIIISSIFLTLTLKNVKSNFIGIMTFIPVVLLGSILFYFMGLNSLIHFSHEEFWLTGQTSFIKIFDVNFYTIRTATFSAALSAEGSVSLLTILAIPYIYTRHIFNIITWSLIVFYFGKDFRLKHVSMEDKRVEKVVFSSLNNFPLFRDYSEGKTRYLVSKKSEIIGEGIEQEREEVKALLKALDKDKLLVEIKPKEQEEIKRFYFTLKYLYNNNQIDFWVPEFSYKFEKVEKQAMYMMYADGRDVFNYPFDTDASSLQDPALISGMFSAITSFIQETTKAKQTLKTIDHGDIQIIIEYGEFIFGALFIKGKQTSEVRAQLREFVSTFESRHYDVLFDWNGALMPFREDHLLVEEIFKEE